MNISNFSHVDITFSSNLTKNEYVFMNYLIDSELKKTRSYHKISSILKMLNLDEEKFLKFLSKLQKKSLNYSFDGKKGSISLLSSYEVEDKYMKLYLCNRLMDLIKEEKDGYDIKTIFNLKEQMSIKFYYKCCFGVGTLKEFDYEIEELKELFDIDSYDRFYDFERFVLKKITKDISDNSQYMVTYEKIKKGESKNNKIMGVKILIANKLYNRISSEIVKLLGKYNNYFNYENAFSVIFELLKEEKTSRIVEALENIKSKGMIEEELSVEVARLKEDDNSYVLIKVIEEQFSNLLKLQSSLFNEVKKIESVAILYDEFVTSSFLKKLYKLNNGESFTFLSKNVKMIINYNKQDISKIEIYKRIEEESEI